MKNFLLIFLLLSSEQIFAGTYISAKLINNNSTLSIQLRDDQSIPPFGAGELWNSLKERQQIKTINETEFKLQCDGRLIANGDVYASCAILIPYNQFKNIKGVMVFKAEGALADKLNKYFNDSAYVTIESDEVYLSAFNTRRQFFFGVNQKLIH
jgi:hypothetical protein